MVHTCARLPRLLYFLDPSGCPPAQINAPGREIVRPAQPIQKVRCDPGSPRSARAAWRRLHLRAPYPCTRDSQRSHRVLRDRKQGQRNGDLPVKPHRVTPSPVGSPKRIGYILESSSNRSVLETASHGDGNSFSVAAPDRLPPGRLKLVTRADLTGSAPIANTTGTGVMTAFAARAITTLSADHRHRRVLRSRLERPSRRLSRARGTRWLQVHVRESGFVPHGQRLHLRQPSVGRRLTTQPCRYSRSRLPSRGSRRRRRPSHESAKAKLGRAVVSLGVLACL